MKRLNFTLDRETVELLDALAARLHAGNKSATVRTALERLASDVHEGWVVSGYTPAALVNDMSCGSCGTPHAAGEVLYRPVYERGVSPNAVPSLPSEPLVACHDCVDGHSGN